MKNIQVLTFLVFAMAVTFSLSAHAERYTCSVQRMTVNPAKKLDFKNIYTKSVDVKEGQARFVNGENDKPYSYRNALFMISRKSGTGLAELIIYLGNLDKTVVSTFNLNGGPLHFRDYSRQFSVQCNPARTNTAALMRGK